MTDKWLTALAIPALLVGMSASQADDELLPPVTIDTGSDLKRSIVPNASTQGEMEPEVVIRKRGKNMVEEYRLNGRLYKVKITPAVGPEYFMVDSDGDGFMDQRYDQPGQAMATPQWVLFSW